MLSGCLSADGHERLLADSFEFPKVDKAARRPAGAFSNGGGPKASDRGSGEYTLRAGG